MIDLSFRGTGSIPRCPIKKDEKGPGQGDPGKRHRSHHNQAFRQPNNYFHYLCTFVWVQFHLPNPSSHRRICFGRYNGQFHLNINFYLLFCKISCVSVFPGSFV